MGSRTVRAELSSSFSAPERWCLYDESCGAEPIAHLLLEFVSRV